MLKFKHLMTGTAMGVVVISGFYSAPALAAGTLAGEVITNEVTVSYEVGGIEQDDEEASDEITVDRKIDLTVARVDDVATEVTPGEEDTAVSFIVENISNDTLDFELDADQVTTGNPAGITGNDAFDVDTPFTFYLDDGDNIFEIGDDTLITHLNALAPDTPVTIHVVTSQVPLSGLDSDDIAAVILTATAREDNALATLGAALVESVSNVVDEVDTVFADGTGDTDGDYDAAFSATDDFLVLTAAITATKTSSIVAGGFAIGAAIPGATIEYCITVTNASGGADADNIVISDTLPSEVTYDSDFGIFVGGADCDTPGPDSGSFADPVVSGTITTLPAGDSQTLIFRATID